MFYLSNIVLMVKQRSTVSAALKSLANKKLIEYEPYELIILTPEGREKAVTIVMNHYIITQSSIATERKIALSSSQSLILLKKQDFGPSS